MVGREKGQKVRRKKVGGSRSGQSKSHLGRGAIKDVVERIVALRLAPKGRAHHACAFAVELPQVRFVELLFGLIRRSAPHNDSNIVTFSAMIQ